MFRFLAASKTVTELVCDCSGDKSMKIGYTVGQATQNIVTVDGLFEYGTPKYKQVTAYLPAGTEIYKMCIVGAQGIALARAGSYARTSYSSTGVTGSLSVYGTFDSINKFAIAGMSGIGVLEQSFKLPVGCTVTVTANGHYDLYWSMVVERESSGSTYPTGSAHVPQLNLSVTGDTSLSAYTTDRIKSRINQEGVIARARNRLNGSAAVCFTVDNWTFPFIATRSAHSVNYKGGSKGILYNQELTGAATWNNFMITDTTNAPITNNVRNLGSKLKNVMLNSILGKYASDFTGCSNYEPVDAEYTTSNPQKTEQGTRLNVVVTAGAVYSSTLLTRKFPPFIPYFPANKQTALSEGIPIKGNTYHQARGVIADSPRLTTSAQALVNYDEPTKFSTYAYLQYGVTTYG